MNNNVVCNQCGNINATNSKFCIKCGNGLNVSIAQTPNEYSQTAQQQSQMTYNEQPVYNNVNNSTPTKTINFVQYIIGAILKPYDKYKSEEENFTNFKNAGILSVIIVLFMTVINLFTTMYNTVRVTSFWTDETEWVWENLRNIEYFKVFGKNLLIYAGILFAISGVYYLASLIIKKDVNFSKLLGATATAYIPFALSSTIASPLLSLIYAPLGMCISIIGLVYTAVILLELINDLIKIDNKNTRIYFHLICISILIIVGGLIAYKLILGSVSDGLGDLSNLF